MTAATLTFIAHAAMIRAKPHDTLRFSAMSVTSSTQLTPLLVKSVLQSGQDFEEILHFVRFRNGNVLVVENLNTMFLRRVSLRAFAAKNVAE